jgi:basic membrane protein A
MKKIALILAFCLIFAGCSENDNNYNSDFSAGLALDADGVESPFNSMAWEALQKAKGKYGTRIEFKTAASENDYEENLNYFVRNEFDMIFTAGFLLRDMTIEYAAANPDKYFGMIDVYNDTTYKNLVGISFSMENACFMAGYLAAGFSKTGVVATFGGMDIPPVNEFITGYKKGVEHYNQTTNASVRFLGENLYTNNFDSKDLSRKVTDSLIAEGADIILPVTGSGGMGALESVNHHKIYIIGTDIDWRKAYPDKSQRVITSVEKKINNAVYNVLSLAIKGKFESGNYIGTLKNLGVGLSPYYDFDTMISQKIKNELKNLEEEFKK